MTRTTTSGVQAEIVKTATLPFHIAKLEFSGLNSFVSEGPEITFSGNAYLDSSLSVKSISFGGSGFEKATIELLDYSNGAIALVLQNKVVDVVCTIYLVYRDSTGSFTTPVLLAKGVLNPVSIETDRVVLSLAPLGDVAGFFPKTYFNKDNGATRLAKSGSIVEWGNEKFQLVN